MRVFLALLLSACGASHEASDGGSADGASLAADAAATADSGQDARIIEAVDAGTDGAAAALDAGAVPNRIVCGAAECDIPRQGCLASCLYATDIRMPACIVRSDDGAFPGDDCPSGREQFPRYWLLCDGAEDCAPGEACHVVYGSLGQYAVCAPDCGEGCAQDYYNRLCRSDADCPMFGAPNCVPDPDLPGYST